MDGDLISLFFLVSVPSLLVGLSLIDFALSAACSCPSANAQMAKMQRWQQPGGPLKTCYFSGIERASRRHKNDDSAASAG